MACLSDEPLWSWEIGGMHLPGEVTALISVIVGAGLTWTTTAWSQGRARRDARASQRREAYAAFILALDHLERAWSAPETLQSEYLTKKMGELTGQAIGEIQRVYVVVLLVGSKQARAAAEKARTAAWDFNNRLNSGREPGALMPRLSDVYDNLLTAAREFVEAARSECE